MKPLDDPPFQPFADRALEVSIGRVLGVSRRAAT